MDALSFQRLLNQSLSFTGSSFPLAVLVSFFLSPATVVIAQDSGHALQASAAIVCKTEITVERSGLSFSRYLVDADLGNVRFGSDIPVTIEIENTSGVALDVDMVEASCSCLAANAKKKVYEPGEKIVMDLLLRVPETAKRSEVQQSITLSKGQNAQKKVEITIRYSIDGLLNFINRTSIAEIPAEDKSTTIIVPFAFSDPVEVSRLVATNDSPGLVRSVEIVPSDNGSGDLKLEIDATQVSEHGVVFTIQLADSKLERSDEAQVRVVLAHQIEIRPAMTRLRKESDGNVKGTAIIYVRKSISEESDVHCSDTPIVTAKVGNESFRCEIHSIADCVFRVSLAIAAEKVSEDVKNHKNIDWTVRAGGKTASRQTNVSFQPVP